MTVQDLLRNISSKELTEWMAYSSIEPFGYESDYRMHALIASVIAEVNRDRSKKKSPYTINDFMPKKEEEKQSVFQKLKSYFKNDVGLSNKEASK